MNVYDKSKRLFKMSLRDYVTYCIMVLSLRALKLLVDDEIDEPRGLGIRLSGSRFTV